MNQEDNKTSSVNFSREGKDPGNLSKEEGAEKRPENESGEVDDKLIGDDLEIEEAQQGSNDKEERPGKQESNY